MPMDGTKQWGKKENRFSRWTLMWSSKGFGTIQCGPPLLISSIFPLSFTFPFGACMFLLQWFWLWPRKFFWACGSWVSNGMVCNSRDTVLILLWPWTWTWYWQLLTETQCFPPSCNWPNPNHVSPMQDNGFATAQCPLFCKVFWVWFVFDEKDMTESSSSLGEFNQSTSLQQAH